MINQWIKDSPNNTHVLNLLFAFHFALGKDMNAFLTSAIYIYIYIYIYI